jgi:hypothetical protein
MPPIASYGEANVTYFRVKGTQGSSPYKPDSHSLSQLWEKVLKRARVQETSFAFDGSKVKGGSFFVFDREVSTVTFCTITFSYGSVSLKLCAGLSSALSSLRQQERLVQTPLLKFPVHLHQLGDYILIRTWSGERALIRCYSLLRQQHVLLTRDGATTPE